MDSKKKLGVGIFHGSFSGNSGKGKTPIANERLKLNRAYFEEGCACINTAKTPQLCPTNMPDSEAVAFYEQHCKCSRNYIQS